MKIKYFVKSFTILLLVSSLVDAQDSEGIEFILSNQNTVHLQTALAISLEIKKCAENPSLECTDLTERCSEDTLSIISGIAELGTLFSKTVRSSKLIGDSVARITDPDRIDSNEFLALVEIEAGKILSAKEAINDIEILLSDLEADLREKNCL